MQDIPQPADEPYEVGDTVKIYLGETDLDSRFHNRVCTIVEVRRDELSDLTERKLDQYEYRLADDGEEIDLWFRHFDLVPVEESD